MGMNKVILTHCGKLGDMLYSLMIGSWLWKKYQRKIHWVLPQCFGPFHYITPLLMAQDQTADVTLVDHKVENYSQGGQPYKFDPATFGISGEYFNFGFRSYPDRFLPAFYASEYGLGFDNDFVLNIGNPCDNNQVVGYEYRSSELAMQMLMPDIQPLPNSIDLLQLARTMAQASVVHSWYCGIAVLCWLARIPAHVYRVQGHAPMQMYFPDKRNLTFHELEVHPKDMQR